jgi:hypothetical protein
MRNNPEIASKACIATFKAAYFMRRIWTTISVCSRTLTSYGTHTHTHQYTYMVGPFYTILSHMPARPPARPPTITQLKQLTGAVG